MEERIDLLKKYGEIVSEIQKIERDIDLDRYEMQYMKMTNDRFGPFGDGGYGLNSNIENNQKRISTLMEEKSKIESTLYKMGMSEEELSEYISESSKSTKL